MKKYINLSTWERRDNFLFFADFLNPFITVTCEVDCSIAKKESTERKESFFLYYLYAILNAINTIDEFRYRIENNDAIISYDQIDAFVPIKRPEAKSFSTIRIPYNEQFSIFKDTAKKIIENTPNEDPYFIEKQNKEFDVVLVSAIPTLPFSSITCTQKNNHGNDYPLINVGKLNLNNKLPIAVSVHHGFVDGQQISDFFRKIEATLMSIPRLYE